MKKWNSSTSLTDHGRDLLRHVPQEFSGQGSGDDGHKSSKLRRAVPKQVKQVGKLLLGNISEDKMLARQSAELHASYESTLPPRMNGAYLTRPLCRITNQEDVVEEDMQNQLLAQAREIASSR
jgi:hypothetical protein